nr:MAG TPA: hypothetical protein [Caudoviricetes sp.]
MIPATVSGLSDAMKSVNDGKSIFSPPFTASLPRRGEEGNIP